MRYFDNNAIYGSINQGILKLYRGEKNILDIGCGQANLAKVLKNINPEVFICGIDVSEDFGLTAKNNLDQFYLTDLDNGILPELNKEFNLIILGDIIEHLKRPDLLLIKLCKLLSKNGYMIISVPNIAHYGIRRRLLFGKFEYVDSGIMDKTHLRFFTDKTMRDLIDKSGLSVIGVEYNFDARFDNLRRIKLFDFLLHKF